MTIIGQDLGLFWFIPCNGQVHFQIDITTAEFDIGKTRVWITRCLWKCPLLARVQSWDLLQGSEWLHCSTFVPAPSEPTANSTHCISRNLSHKLKFFVSLEEQKRFRDIGKGTQILLQPPRKMLPRYVYMFTWMCVKDYGGQRSALDVFFNHFPP